MTLREVGELLGCDPKTVLNHERRIIEKLRAAIMQDEELVALVKEVRDAR